MKDLILLDAAQQAGADYLGGGLAKNLHAAARFNQTLGQIPKVADEASYAAAVNATFARGVGG
jgi:taurine transport system substrate-binding protein